MIRECIRLAAHRYTLGEISVIFFSNSATMGDTALKAIDNWWRCRAVDETLRYTQALGLKRNCGTFQKLECLSKWLAGDYNNFEEMAAVDEHTAWVQRANARRTFLDRTSGSDHDISWANSTTDEPHPLEVLKAGYVELPFEVAGVKRHIRCRANSGWQSGLLLRHKFCQSLWHNPRPH